MGRWLSLAAGGLTGTFARYVLAGWVYGVAGAGFPYGTLVVNLLGCFLIGFLAALAEARALLPPNARVLLMAGFCGAFTTFSTFMLETGTLIKGGEMMKALLNIVLSVVVGFVVFRLGGLVAELL